jgi:hypothetical protein
VPQQDDQKAQEQSKEWTLASLRRLRRVKEVFLETKLSKERPSGCVGVRHEKGKKGEEIACVRAEDERKLIISEEFLKGQTWWEYGKQGDDCGRYSYSTVLVTLLVYLNFRAVGTSEVWGPSGCVWRGLAKVA